MNRQKERFLDQMETLSEKKKESLAAIWEMQDLFLKGSEQHQALEQAQSLLLGIEIDVPEFDVNDDNNNE